MTRLIIDIKDSILSEVIHRLSDFPKSEVRILRDTEFSSEDIKAYNTAKQELSDNQTVSFDTLKQSIKNV